MSGSPGYVPSCSRKGPIGGRRSARAEPSTSCRDTADIRAGDWTVAPAPPALRDRRVEMTGPTERKMTINALNSGAQVWLADLEDASTPHWHNVIGGQVNLYDAIRETITFTSPEGKSYALADLTPGSPPDDRGASARLAPGRAHITVSTATRPWAPWSTSGCTSSTTRPSCCPAATARTSTCPSWRAISRPGSGTTSSPSPSPTRAWRPARSVPPCSSRPSRPRSRWRRSCTSCATTPPASTPGGGTTCSA